MNRVELSYKSCHLLGDIGGTNARFAFVTDGSLQLHDVTRFSCSDFDSLEAAITAYRRRVQEHFLVDVLDVCLAVAAPVNQDLVQFTNNPWRFSKSDLSHSLGLPCHILNDFAAQAYCLGALQPDDVLWWQRPDTFAGLSNKALRTVVGPGTGFGASTLTAEGEVLAGEPGHISFAPVDDHEVQLLQRLWQRYERVTPEHLVSGPGLANLYWANSVLHSAKGVAAIPAAADIVARATAGEILARRSVHDFCAILGSICGDIALLQGSLGGMYLSGDMLEKMGKLFDKELFLARFRAKGAFERWCREVPVGRLTLAWPGLAGCAVFAHRPAPPQAHGGAR